MIILAIRTDKPEAEVGLFDDERELTYNTWLAHRQLSVTIHQKIEDLLHLQHKKLADVQGIVAFQGPGSFTGLRIGLTVANTLAYALDIPIVGAQHDDDWVKNGIQKLIHGNNEKIVMPEYGAPVHITQQKK